MDVNNFDKGQSTNQDQSINQGQPMYQEQQMYQGPQQSKGLAIASMVCGIIALLFGCCLWRIGWILSILAIVFGAVSMTNKQGGKGMAIAGIVCGVLSLLPTILGLLFGMALVDAFKEYVSIAYFV
jgi:hypothetical protein